MGILSNLFKQKSAGTNLEPRKSRYQSSVPTSDPAPVTPATAERDFPSGETDQAPSTPASSEQPLKSISFGGSRNSVSAGAASQKKNITSTPAPEIVKATRKAVANCGNTIPDKQIIIPLEDLISQIPSRFLKTVPPAHLKKELVFKTYELLAALKSGKASVSLSRIAELSPELFGDQHPDENVEVQLPLQKVVSQIGAFPCRPDQTEVVFPPLDPKFANLVIEKNTAPDVKIDQPVSPIAGIAENLPASAPVKTGSVVTETTEKSQAAPVDKVDDQPADEPIAEIEEKTEMPFDLPVIDEKVSYSLAALMPNMPKSWLAGDAKSIGDDARLTVPFHLVEAQLATGRVELSFEDFLNAVPDDFKKHFSGNTEENKAARIQVPLNEVFQNLPGVEPLPPTPKPTAPEIQEEPESAPEAIVVEAEADVNPIAAEVVNHEPVSVENPDTVATEELKAEQPLPAQANIAEPLPLETAEAVASKEPVVENTPEAQKTESPEPKSAEPQPEPLIEATEAPIPEETAKPEEPAVPVEAVNPIKVPQPEPVGIQLPTYRDPATDQEQAAATLAPPKVQLQRIVPPSVFAKEFSATPAEEHVQEPEPGKILAFEGASLAFNPNAVETLFMTDGKLDAPKTVKHISHFPGLQGVALTFENETTTAGEIPDNFNAANTAKAASVLFQTLENPSDQPGAAVARNVTLNHPGFSSTWFQQDHILLGVLHPQRTLEEAMHDKLVLVTGELAQLR